MKKRLLLFCLLAMLLLGGGIALYTCYCRNAPLRPYPAEHVATARDYLHLLKEINDILGSGQSEEQKCAELTALRPRMEEVDARLRRMSSYRFFELHKALGVDSARDMPHLLTCNTCAREQKSPAARCARELLDILGSAPELTPAAAATALLQQVEELEARLQTAGLSEMERNEAFDLNQDKLLFIHCYLYPAKSGARAFAEAMESTLRETPGAVERLSGHLARMKPASNLPSDIFSSSQEAYYHHLEGMLLHRLPELLPEGRQGLARLENFLLERPQASFYLGSLQATHEEETMPRFLYNISHHLCPEGAEPRPFACRYLYFTLAEEMPDELRRNLIYGPLCLLRCAPGTLRVTPQGHGEITTPVPQTDIFVLPGGGSLLEHVLRKHPDWLTRLHRPDDTPTAPSTPQP